MVYSIIRSDSIAVQSNETDYETYDYWEDEYDENASYDESLDYVPNDANQDSTSHKASVSSKKVSSKKTSSKKISSKKASSIKTSSKKISSKSSSSKKTSSKITTSKEASSRTTTSIEKYTDMVNINTASKEQLCSLDGIGEVLAQNIIDFRENAGGFESIEDIMYVNGIGEGKFEQIKDRITIS